MLLLVSLSFLCLRDYLANFSSGFVFVLFLFLFEISNVAPGTKHKHKQKAKKQNQNEPKKHTILVDLLCLSAASARSVIRVSLHLLRRVRIKRLSLANWASLSVERKTKPPERAESARESKAERERDRVGAFACWSCASFCEVSVRSDYTRSGSLTLIKLDKNISNHEGCSCHCCWGPCAAYQERERLLEKLARFEARPYTRFKINKQVKNLQLMRNTCDCSCHMRYSRNTDIPIIIAADIDDASANWISIEMSDAFALRVINN